MRKVLYNIEHGTHSFANKRGIGGEKMECLRCGRKTEGEQAFCKSCLQSMERFPVDPDSVVQLPRRKNAPPPKKALRRRILSPEERIAVLRRRNRRLAIALAVLVLTLVLLAIPTVRFFVGTRYRPGQNYKILPSTTSTEAVTEPTPGS